MLQWPSERVKPGGVFQPAKVSYSAETKNFIKVLLDESKLTMMQRQKVNYSLRSGEPLPSLARPSKSFSKKPTILVRPGTSKRRSRNAIVNSGAYEVNRYIPSFPKVDREKAKKHLQELMANGKKMAESPRRPKPTKKQEGRGDGPPENRFDQLVREIEDRKNWLKEMEELGEGEKYKNVIELQIQEKLREMKQMKMDLPETWKKYF